MASYYSSGSAASFLDLRNAIQTFVTTNGFTNEAGPTSDHRIIKKSPIFVKMESNAKYLRMTAGVSVASSDIVTPSLTVQLADPDLTPITFPINYELYLYQNPDEFYCIINYNGSRYQHINFGISNVPSISGAGVWLTGSMKSDVNLSDLTNMKVFVNCNRSPSNKNFAIPSYSGYALGYFLNSHTEGSGQSSSIHCGLEGADSWRNYGYSAGDLSTPLDHSIIMDLPSLFNEADTLLPIRSVLQRASSNYTIVADLVNVRLCRLDNRAPGDVVVYGSDSWKLYPLFTKNTDQRNGVAWSTGALHSGTFGVALKVPV